MSRSARSCALFVVLVCGLAQPLAGQDRPFVIPDTVVEGRPDPFPANPLNRDTLVSPNSTVSRSGQVGSAVTVIDEEELRQSQRATVGEVLRGRLGVDVVRSGGPGGVTSVFMRGANSQHTKVLIDGVPVNDPSGPTRAFDFSTLSVDNIQRIEVLRGPQSLLYGSDAIGGVINIVTKRGEGPPRISTTTSSGSFGTIRQSARVSGGSAAYYYSLGGSYLHTDGISAANSRNGNSERDRYRSGNVSGRFGWTPSDALAIDYVFRYADVDAQVDSFMFGMGFTDDVGRANRTDTFFQRVQVSHSALDGEIQTRAGFSLTDYLRRDTKPDFGPPRFDGLSRQFDLRTNLQLTGTNVLTGGVDYLDEVASSTFVTAVGQNNLGVFVSDQWQWGENWFNTVGARWDDHSAAGDASTYRFTSLYNLAQYGASLHGSIGTGFRAPALAQNFFTGGNPDLRPERSKGWDFGLQKSCFDGGLILDVTYYRNDFVDLIDFDFISFMSRNIGLAKAHGIEAQADLLLTETTSMRVNYTLTDSQDRQFGGRLARRPVHKAALVLTQRMCCDDVRLHLFVNYIGDRLDLPARFGGGVLDDYFLVNVAADAQLTETLQVFGRIENLFDEIYEEAAGFGAPGIAGYAGVRWDY